jgi:hypothetical protein
MYPAALGVVGAAKILANPAISALCVCTWCAMTLHASIGLPPSTATNSVGPRAQAGSPTGLLQLEYSEELRDVQVLLLRPGHVDHFVERVLFEMPDRAAFVVRKLYRRVAFIIVKYR